MNFVDFRQSSHIFTQPVAKNHAVQEINSKKFYISATSLANIIAYIYSINIKTKSCISKNLHEKNSIIQQSVMGKKKRVVLIYSAYLHNQLSKSFYNFYLVHYTVEPRFKELILQICLLNRSNSLNRLSIFVKSMVFRYQCKIPLYMISYMFGDQL